MLVVVSIGQRKPIVFGAWVVLRLLSDVNYNGREHFHSDGRWLGSLGDGPTVWEVYHLCKYGYTAGLSVKALWS
jgi:hypothetical protein